MRYIAHRGNLYGPSDKENEPSYIKSALNSGFDVEIDVWSLDGIYYLGHDEPKYEINSKFLEHPNILCHAKNVFVLERLAKNPLIHWFWHDKDDYTLTSHMKIVTYPGKILPALSLNSILMMPEMQIEPNLSKADSLYYFSLFDMIVKGTHRCWGICSDYIARCKELKEGV